MRIVLDLSAEQVADLLCQLNELPATPNGLIDSHAAAEVLGVGVEYIRAHAAELGAVRLGDGPKARLRFDPAKLKNAVVPRVESSSETTAPKRRRRRAPAGGALEVRGTTPYV